MRRVIIFPVHSVHRKRNYHFFPEIVHWNARCQSRTHAIGWWSHESRTLSGSRTLTFLALGELNRIGQQSSTTAMVARDRTISSPWIDRSISKGDGWVTVLDCLAWGGGWPLKDAVTFKIKTFQTVLLLYRWATDQPVSRGQPS